MTTIPLGIGSDGPFLTHGKVRPLPGGATADCDGPGLCPTCDLEASLMQLRSAFDLVAETLGRVAERERSAIVALDRLVGCVETLAVADVDGTVVHATRSALGVARRVLERYHAERGASIGLP